MNNYFVLEIVGIVIFDDNICILQGILCVAFRGVLLYNSYSEYNNPERIPRSACTSGA